MIQTSEYCGVGHPDRTCDYIASYILDRHLERDRDARVALEVQLKDAFCTVSGEVTCATPFTDEEIARTAAHSLLLAPTGRLNQLLASKRLRR